MLELTATTTTTNPNPTTITTTLTHSSFPSLNQQAMTTPAKVMLVDVFKNETNNDDYIDSIQFKILIILEPSQTITNAKLMLFMDYIIQTKAKMQMQTMCYVNIDTPNGASQIITNGKLVLHQKMPIKVLPFIDNSKAFNYFGPDSPNKSPTPSMLEVYDEFTSKRDYTTQYNYRTRVKPNYSDNTLEIILNIDIPSKQQIM